MKKNVLTKAFLALVAASSICMIGCPNGTTEEPDGPDVAVGTLGTPDPVLLASAKAASELDPKNENLIIFYKRADSDYSKYGLWLWPDGTSEGQNGYDLTAGKAKTKTIDGTTIAYWNISELCASDTKLMACIKEKGKMGKIIRDSGWTKDPDGDQFMDMSEGMHFLTLTKDPTLYIVSDSYDPTIAAASAVTKDSIKVSLSVKYGLETSASSNGFTVVAADGTEIAVNDVLNYNAQNNRNRNFADTLLLKLSSDIDLEKEWYVKNSIFKPEAGVKVSKIAAIKAAYKDYIYKGTDLGLTLNGTKASFKTWAPVASDVQLLLFKDSSQLVTEDSVVKMTSDEYGIWSVSDVDVSSFKYYKFRITNEGVTRDVCDIYAKVASGDSVAAQIADINDAETQPAGWESAYRNPFSGEYTDAVIYEMHIRDWSRATVTDSTGKFLDIANSDAVINHLKELGVTHVQILPMFDYAEKNADKNYNWGYNPYHYNVPEGRYVTEGYTDGTQAVKEMREMILALHKAGIAVNMDVVYNHTSGTGEYSLYDSTIPYYYYRMKEDGSYSDGSGCGNETDSEAPMFRSYMIESLKHWMKDYHINGFRFDLMGVHSKEAMTEVYNALKEIDPKVMVYGEPWTGGDCAVTNGMTGAINAGDFGVAAFDDDFRDAIKGAEFGGFKHGQVQGTYNDSGIITGLVGDTGKNNRNPTGKPGLALHYVECHDNYTLFDKLAISYWRIINKITDPKKVTTGNLFTKIGEDGLATVREQDKLAAAYVFLSQGTPFINGGQEFLRTKRGDENSYKSSDQKNSIDLSFKETYSDVYNTYKGLIAFRKANSDAFGANTSASATKVKTGVTKYTAGDFLVYFNATNADVAIEAADYTKSVDVSSGTPTEAPVPTNVAPKSFVILKK